MMSERHSLLRANAEKIDSSRSCSICQENLTVAYGYRRDRGICINCGLPYRINPDENEILDKFDPILESYYEPKSREIRCIREYYEDVGKPAPIWSYSVLKSIEFIRFSQWAEDNGYEDYSWTS